MVLELDRDAIALVVGDFLLERREGVFAAIQVFPDGPL